MVMPFSPASTATKRSDPNAALQAFGESGHPVKGW
jgi:hypothetical protein